MYNIENIRNKFMFLYDQEEFIIDKTGAKTLEILGASFIANEPAIFGEPNTDYIEKEIKWYNSLSTNVNDIYGDERPAPKAWNYAADKYGNINSNYGFLIFSPRFNNQYAEAVFELQSNPNSRRAIMIYNRPTMWEEYKENGKNDFICTNAVSYYIRDDKVHCVVQMRSNDVYYGFRNDYAWQDYVLTMMCEDLDVEKGDMHWQVQNLHVYEKDFKLIEEYKNELPQFYIKMS